MTESVPPSAEKRMSVKSGPENPIQEPESSSAPAVTGRTVNRDLFHPSTIPFPTIYAYKLCERKFSYILYCNLIIVSAENTPAAFIEYA